MPIDIKDWAVGFPYTQECPGSDHVRVREESGVSSSAKRIFLEIFPVFKLVPNYRNTVPKSISNALWCVRGRRDIFKDSMSVIF
jgi:hypothetical protein